MAADFDTVANLVRGWFNTKITTVLPLSTGFDNADFTPPTSGTWCACQVRFDGRADAAIGQPRVQGTLEAQLYGESDQGTADVQSKAASIADVFDGLQIGGPPVVSFFVSEIQTVGPTGRGYWQLNVSCPFYSDEV